MFSGRFSPAGSLMPLSAVSNPRVQAPEPAYRADLAAGRRADALRGDSGTNHFTVIELLADPQSAMTARVAHWRSKSSVSSFRRGRAKSTQADAARSARSRQISRGGAFPIQDRGDDADRGTAKDPSDAVIAGRRRTIANHSRRRPRWRGSRSTPYKAGRPDSHARNAGGLRISA